MRNSDGWSDGELFWIVFYVFVIWFIEWFVMVVL